MSKELSEQYPSVGLAYGFAVESYDLALKRFDAMEARLSTLVSLAVTVTLAIPVALKTLGMTLGPRWLSAVVVTFVVTMIIGTWGRLGGALKVIDPRVLYEDCLHLSEWQFK